MSPGLSLHRISVPLTVRPSAPSSEQKAPGWTPCSTDGCTRFLVFTVLVGVGRGFGVRILGRGVFTLVGVGVTVEAATTVGVAVGVGVGAGVSMASMAGAVSVGPAEVMAEEQPAVSAAARIAAARRERIVEPFRRGEQTHCETTDDHGWLSPSGVLLALPRRARIAANHAHRGDPPWPTTYCPTT